MREITAIRDDFKNLHTEAADLLGDAMRLRSSFKLMFRRRPLRNLEGRLDDRLKKFLELDKQLAEHTAPSNDINSAMRFAAQFSVYSALRDSVRGLLTDTSSTLSALRAHLETRTTVLLAAVAIVIALVALGVDAASFIKGTSGQVNVISSQ